MGERDTTAKTNKLLRQDQLSQRGLTQAVHHLPMFNFNFVAAAQELGAAPSARLTGCRCGGGQAGGHWRVSHGDATGLLWMAGHAAPAAPAPRCMCSVMGILVLAFVMVHTPACAACWLKVSRAQSPQLPQAVATPRSTCKSSNDKQPACIALAMSRSETRWQIQTIMEWECNANRSHLQSTEPDFLRSFVSTGRMASHTTGAAAHWRPGVKPPIASASSFAHPLCPPGRVAFPESRCALRCLSECGRIGRVTRSRATARIE
jgi:hypothetical protein